MSKIFTTIFLVLFLFTNGVQAQSFTTIEHLDHFSPGELAAKFLFITTFDFGADVYKVTYESTDLSGNPTTVSGLFTVPDDPTKVYPIACYQHGTAGSNQDVPSGLGLDSDLAIAMSGKGYVTVSPDLLGLGVHPGIHPYMHAESAAWVAADMMRAMKNYVAANDIFINDQVFISGYSQGGHSAMALYRHLQENLSDEFTVTAAAPMSGPYSMAEVMRDLILSEEEYTRPGYLINTFISYQSVYGNIYTDIASTFRPPYQQLVEDFSNEAISLGEMDQVLDSLLVSIEGASIPLRVLKESYVQKVVNNPDHPMNLAMLENNVYDWAPQSPTRLYYCEMDEEVPFENSLVAESTMQANGAPDVLAVNSSPVLDHFLCAFIASLSAIDFFAEYQELGEVPVSNKAVYENGLTVYPNPTSGKVFLEGMNNGGEAFIFDAQGRLVMQQLLSVGNHEIDLSDLGKGSYFIKVIDGEKLNINMLLKH